MPRILLMFLQMNSDQKDIKWLHEMRNYAQSDSDPNMLSVGFLVSICCLALEAVAYKSVYVKVSNGVDDPVKATFALKQPNGLIKEDKQRILDMHNTLRLRLALGKETNSWDGKPGNGRATMPPAANMLVLDWNDKLAAFAQRHANKRVGEHSDMNVKAKKFAEMNMAENLSGDITALETDMYGEVQYWNYDKFECQSDQQCGHYLAFAKWGFYNVGCGWNTWKDVNQTAHKAMFCVFAGIDTSATSGDVRKPIEREYLKGKPCSKCYQGWDYCMNGGLCATKKQCMSDPMNKCVCLNDRTKCEKNGGTFKAQDCSCSCPADRMGRNCEKKCANEKIESCGITCSMDVSNAFRCPKTCGGCGGPYSSAYKFMYVDRTADNKDDIKSRAHFETLKLTAADFDLSKKKLFGKCKNVDPDRYCQELFHRGYCQDVVLYKPLLAISCPVSCGSRCPAKVKIDDSDMASIGVNTTGTDVADVKDPKLANELTKDLNIKW